MIHFLNLIRYKNLLLLAFMQILVRFAFLDNSGIWQSLTWWHYSVLIIATLCIAAGGYIINDIYDVDTDSINKPIRLVIGKFISESKANYAYVITTSIGVVLGIYLSRLVQKPAFAIVFVIAAALLYVYSNGLKQIPIVGNLLVAVVSSLSIVVIILFNLLPAMYSENHARMMQVIEVLLDYTYFAIVLHFIREIIKCIEDYEGDKAYEISTVATSFGIKMAKYIFMIVTIAFVGYLVYYVYSNLSFYRWAAGYFIIAIIAPLLFSIYKTYTAKEKSDFTFVSKVLKFVMLTIIISLAVIMLNAKYVA
jgi:4-hydroxybenzoate polyprenyltransferase